jgi:hypothetical protein
MNIHGRLINKPVEKYAINWDAKSRSNVQFLTKQFLKPFWQPHIVFEEFPVFGTLLKVDILNMTMKIAVEVHGNQHESFNSFFHKGNPANFLKGFKNDAIKMKWLERNGFQVVEIYENEVPSLTRAFFQEKFGITL